jgi:hypothetical protein
MYRRLRDCRCAIWLLGLTCVVALAQPAAAAPVFAAGERPSPTVLWNAFPLDPSREALRKSSLASRDARQQVATAVGVAPSKPSHAPSWATSDGILPLTGLLAGMLLVLLLVVPNRRRFARLSRKSLRSPVEISAVFMDGRWLPVIEGKARSSRARLGRKGRSAAVRPRRRDRPRLPPPGSDA